MKIAVIGAGSWGTVLAQILADNGHEVCLWARNPQKADQIQRTRRNQDYLPDLELSPSILVTHDLQQTIERASVLVFVVPSKGMAAVAQQAAAFTDCREQILLSCTKGFDLATGKLMTDILEETFPQAKAVAALSGPNLAKKLPSGSPLLPSLPARIYCQGFAEDFYQWIFRPYTSRDVIGVELCGCSKNCIALVSGILAGLGFGEKQPGRTHYSWPGGNHPPGGENGRQTGYFLRPCRGGGPGGYLQQPPEPEPFRRGGPGPGQEPGRNYPGNPYGHRRHQCGAGGAAAGPGPWGGNAHY